MASHILKNSATHVIAGRLHMAARYRKDKIFSKTFKSSQYHTKPQYSIAASEKASPGDNGLIIPTHALPHSFILSKIGDGTDTFKKALAFPLYGPPNNEEISFSLTEFDDNGT
jgi:hypothetical protein